MRAIQRALPILLLATLAACDDTSDGPSDGGTDGGAADGGASDGGGGDGGEDATLLADEFMFELDSFGGCTDTWLHAWDGDGRVGLELYVPGIFADAVSAGGPVIRPLAAGVDDFELKVEVAEPVAINYCTDAQSDRDVLETWTATSGGLVVTMEPPFGDGEPGKASIDVNMVELQDGAGHIITMPGWLALEIPVVQDWGG